MPNNESIHDRITQLVNEFGGGKNTTFASIIGSSEANVRGYRATVMPKYDFLEKIARSFDIDLKWLLTGEGFMLCNSKTSEEATMDHGTEKVQSASSEAITLRMMDKLDEKDNIIKEKDAKIDQLQSELRAQSAELGTLKARLEHLQDAKEASQWELPNPVKDFTDKSSGDYGEGYSPTKPHTTSKRSSAGKI